MPSHRSGTGSPLVLLHGLTGSWRNWQSVIPQLEEHHDVFAPTFPGHRLGPDLGPGKAASVQTIADALEAMLDDAGIATAHFAGVSLGGWLALELGRRGRARSVVAFSPAGGWARDRDLRRVVALLRMSRALMTRHEARVRQALLRPRLRKALLFRAIEHGDRVSPAAAHELLTDSLGCAIFDEFVASVRAGGPLAAAGEADYPIRIAWGEKDRTLPFQSYGRPLMTAVPGAELVMLPDVGHGAMYDDPALVARTILEVTQPIDLRKGNPMTQPSTLSLDGTRGSIAVHRWDNDSATFVVVLVHGYGEHSRRYDHVAERLIGEGAVVYAPDHAGHGRSEGERALVEDVDDLVADVDQVAGLARSEHPGLPVVVLGHSLGGIIATRYVQTRDPDLAALVLSGPVIGGNPAFEALLAMDPIPDVPIDPAALSRDPAVGEAYAADELVYHGPFKRQTLEALFAAIGEIPSGPALGSLPTLWIHGELDPLAPLDATRPVVEQIRGEHLEERIYPGAMHEILNETNSDEVLDDVVAFVSNVLSEVGQRS